MPVRQIRHLHFHAGALTDDDAQEKGAVMP